MTINFFLPVLTQPRYQKRITAIIESQKDVNYRIYSFERKYIPLKFPFPYESLGNMPDSYYKRLIMLPVFIYKMYSKVKNKEIIYAFGWDIALYASIIKFFSLKKIDIVYEVADIREISVQKNFIGNLIRIIEKFIVKQIKVLVVTSKAFLNTYFHDKCKVHAKNELVIENKIYKSVPKADFNYNNNGKIKIGYFGLLRCEFTWEILKQISLLKNYQIIIYGYPYAIKNFKKELNKYSNIQYKGTYNGYNELYKIYNEVDMVWAAYPYSNKQEGNWKWARTNRFYESCYFKKPMIVLENTQDAKVVLDYDLGLIISPQKTESFLKQLSKINNNNFIKWKDNFNKLPQSIYLYTNEHKKLLNLLKQK